MGPTNPPSPGNFSLIFTGINQPTKITITSTGGGSASSGVTRVR
jgi:hypothetical protein